MAEPAGTTEAARRLVRRLEHVWAADEVARAEALARIDPSSGAEVFPVGGGWAVIAGLRRYVNRVLAAGLDGPVEPGVIDRFEWRARELGVTPAFDLSDLCEAEFVAELTRRGYTEALSITAVAMRLDAAAVSQPTTAGVVVEQAGRQRLSEWRHTNALGWGQLEPEARRVSDLLAEARAASGELLFTALDARDGRPLGTGALRLTGGVATIGGMATLPSERGRGVQRALIAARLAAARAAGCGWLTATARSDGASLRNLLRLGFAATHTKRVVSRA